MHVDIASVTAEEYKQCMHCKAVNVKNQMRRTIQSKGNQEKKGNIGNIV